VEDLALSLQDFEALCGEGSLKPHAHTIIIKPHLRVWKKGRVSAHVEIEGFTANSLLRVAGFPTQAGAPSLAEEQKKMAFQQMERALPQFLKKSFPECEVTVSPVTITNEIVTGEQNA